MEEKKTRLTTLCYLKRDGRYLMMFRNKKKDDQSEGKYLAIGGKLQAGESPEECALREIREETGFEANDLTFRGIVTFVSDVWDNELMFLYSAEQLSGTQLDRCDEGELVWIEEKKMLTLPMWEGDPYFVKPILNEEDDIHIKLVYRGEKLVEAYDKGNMILCVLS